MDLHIAVRSINTLAC